MVLGLGEFGQALPAGSGGDQIPKAESHFDVSANGSGVEMIACAARSMRFPMKGRGGIDILPGVEELGADRREIDASRSGRPIAIERRVVSKGQGAEPEFDRPNT